jgi:hypothetical protein
MKRATAASSRRAAAVLATLLVLLGLGAPAAAAGTASPHAVVVDNVAAAASGMAVRPVRQHPTQLPALPLQPTAGALPMLPAPVLLLAVWLPLWLLSRRSRQAFLLTAAGPGPPSYS